MTVSRVSTNRLALPAWSSAVAAVAGFVSLLATYWDDAWHTDLGRDDATIAPHLLLYGSVAVAGIVVAWWGVRALLITRSLPTVLRHGPVMVAAIAGAATLAAAPLDAAWHTAFGRDAVLWSPPHMLVVLASAAMVLGIAAGARGSRSGLPEAALAGLFLGGLMMSVLEYETDVPQFSEVLYLPVALVAGLSAAVVARRLVPWRAPVTTMVAVYVVVRIATIAVLAVMGRTTPEVPVAVLGLGLLDLPWRTTLQRYSAAAAAMSALALTTAATGLSERPVSAVAVVAVPVMAVFLASVLLDRPRSTPMAATISVVLAGAISLAAPMPGASAHDPGQGESAGAVTVGGRSDGNGRLELSVEVPDTCADLTPVRITARRAGTTVFGPLGAMEKCRFTGTVTVPDDGRWFVYAEFLTGGGPLEVWLPLIADQSDAVGEARHLYRPAEATAATRGAQVGAAIGIYAVGAGLLGAAAFVFARRSRVRRF